MKPIRNIIYVRANAQERNIHRLATGKELFIADPIATSDKYADFNEYERVVQYGIIVHLPTKIEPHYVFDQELKEGDKIWFHHFVVAEDNQDTINDEKLYRCHYRDVYAIERDGELIPVQDYVFLSYVMEEKHMYMSESGLFIKPEPTTQRNIGLIEYSCKTAERYGLKKGDKVYWLDNSDYKMTINGKEYIRMKLNRIVALVEEDSKIDL